MIGLRVEAGAGTAVVVRWTTSESATSVARWGEAEDQQASGESGTAHRVVIAGMEPNLDVPFEVISETELGATLQDSGEFTTPPAPPGLPGLTVDAHAEAPRYLATAVMGQKTGATILSSEGYFVWWEIEGASGLTVSDAQVTPDGRAILYNRFSPGAVVEELGAEAPADLVRSPLDGSEPEVTATPGAHHAFAQLPDGAVAYLAYDVRDVDGKAVRGDALVERSKDGSERTLWSTWDTFEYDPAVDVQGVGWTHCNSLTWDDDEEVFYVSVRNLSAVVKLTRSGERIWTFGGRTSDYELIGDAGPTHQHRVRGEDGGAALVVFDNGAGSEGVTRVVRYALDAVTMTATASVLTAPGFYTYSLGDFARLPDGGLLTSWGSAGAVTFADANGTIQQTVSADLGHVFGFGQTIPDIAALGW